MTMLKTTPIDRFLIVLLHARKNGMTTSDTTALLTVARYWTIMRKAPNQRGIAKLLQSQPKRIGVILDRLEEAGMVTTEHRAHKGRRHRFVYVTEKANRLISPLRES